MRKGEIEAANMRKIGYKNIYGSHERFFLGATSLVAVLIIWEIVGHLDIINPIFFAWPSTIAVEFYKILQTGELYPHLSATFYELILGFFLGCLAIPLGILMGRSRTWQYLLDPIVSIFYAMPRIALMPLIILILGIGVESKVALVFLGCFFPILINVFEGMKNIDPLKIDVGKVYGARGTKLAGMVYIPSIMPYLLAGFRMAVAMGLVMAVVAEFFSGTQGIGYMIALEAGFFNTSALMSWVLVISVLALVLTELVKYFEKRWMLISEFFT